MIDWNAEQWTAFGQIGSLVVATVAGVLVWLQVRHGREIREDQTRPYIIVNFEFREQYVHVVAKNIGTTPARDVEVEFIPPLRSIYPSEAGAVAFVDGIPMLAPGRSISIDLGSGHYFFRAKDRPPLRYEATVQYTAMQGKRPYLDPPLILDLRPYERTTIERDNLQEIATQLKAIRWLLKTWSSGHRLKVLVTTEPEIGRRVEARRARLRAANGMDRKNLTQKVRGFVGDIRSGRAREASRGEIGDDSP